MKKLFLLLLMVSMINLNFTSKVYRASYYGKTHHGKRTSSGERFNMYSLTAAHKTLKFGTKILVTNLNNHKTVIVKINDRGPYVSSRELDLSQAAFETISSRKVGVIDITYEVLDENL